MTTHPIRALSAALAVLALTACAANDPPPGPAHAVEPAGPPPTTPYVTAHGSTLWRDGAPTRLVVLDLPVDIERDAHDDALTSAALDAGLAVLVARGADAARIGFDGRWFERDRAGFLDWLDALVSAAHEAGLDAVPQMRMPIGGRLRDAASPGPDRSLRDDAGLARRNARLWRAVAERFADRPEVAGYDLLHAPVTGDPDGSTWRALAARLTAAIREVDTAHLVVVPRLHGARGLRERGDAPDLDEQFTLDDPNVLYDAGGDAPAPGSLLPVGPPRLDEDGAVRTADVAPGTTDWTRVESAWAEPARGDVDFGIAAVAVEGALGGRIAFDDLRVVERGPDGGERVVLDAPFDGDAALDWSHRVEKAGGDTVDAARLPDGAGGTSLALALRGTGIFLRTGWSNPSAAFPVVPGAAYRIEGRVRGEAVHYLAGPGGAHAGFALGFVRRPKGGGPSFTEVGGDARAIGSEPWLAFGHRHAVPVATFGDWPARAPAIPAR